MQNQTFKTTTITAAVISLVTIALAPMTANACEDELYIEDSLVTIEPVAQKGEFIYRETHYKRDPGMNFSASSPIGNDGTPIGHKVEWLHETPETRQTLGKMEVYEKPANTTHYISCETWEYISGSFNLSCAGTAT